MVGSRGGSLGRSSGHKHQQPTHQVACRVSSTFERVRSFRIVHPSMVELCHFCYVCTCAESASADLSRPTDKTP